MRSTSPSIRSHHSTSSDEPEPPSYVPVDIKNLKITFEVKLKYLLQLFFKCSKPPIPLSRSLKMASGPGQNLPTSSRRIPRYLVTSWNKTEVRRSLTPILLVSFPA